MHAYTYLCVETVFVPAFTVLVHTHTPPDEYWLSFGAGGPEVSAVWGVA